MKYIRSPAAVAVVDDDVAAVDAADGPLELVGPLLKKEQKIRIKRASFAHFCPLIFHFISIP